MAYVWQLLGATSRQLKNNYYPFLLLFISRCRRSAQIPTHLRCELFRGSHACKSLQMHYCMSGQRCATLQGAFFGVQRRHVSCVWLLTL